MKQIRFIASVCATLFLLTVPVVAQAQTAVTRATRSAPSPFELVLGQSTLQEAEAKWAANGVVITSRGHAAIGAGSGVDGMSTLPAERIVLVDVDAAPLEGSRPARFVFFDGVLYSVQTVLRPLLQPKGTNVQSLTEQEVLDLEKQMRQRYGAPTQSLRDMTAGKKPNIFVWNFERNTLTLAIGTLAGSTLSYTNAALAKKADAYKDKVCRSIRACGGGK